MPVPAKKRTKHYRGDDFQYSFRLDHYIDPNNKELGTEPVDLTGWSAVVEPDPDVAGDNSISLTVSEPDATGVITVKMPAESTTDTAFELIEFDIQLINPDGFRRTYLHVIITLIDQVP